MNRSGSLLAVALLLVGASPLMGDATTEPAKKPGFFGRITKSVSESARSVKDSVTGIFDAKKKPQETPPPPAKPPAPKPSVKAKPKPTTKAPGKPKQPTKPTTKPREKSEPVSMVAKEEAWFANFVGPWPELVGPAELEIEGPPAPVIAKVTMPAKPTATITATKTPATTSGDLHKGGGEFDGDMSAAFGGGSATKSVSSAGGTPPSATNLPPPPPLPVADGSWQMVRYDGRDYVTAESIQRFYRFSTIKRDGRHVWLRSPTILMKMTIGSLELLINNVKFILSFSIAESGGKALLSRVDLVKLVDPIMRPNYITSAEPFDTVVIDAGHGGHDSGARGVYGFEKDFTLQMASSLDAALKTRGFKTVFTRKDDTFISLSDRFAVANRTPRSIFISLHFNSSSPEANGIETWSLAPQGTESTFMGTTGGGASFTGNNHDSENIALATAVHGMVLYKFKLVDRGIKRARWTVLTGCMRPAILFEGGFITNSAEGRLVASPSFRVGVTAAIADAVVNYRRALQPNVVQQRR